MNGVLKRYVTRFCRRPTRSNGSRDNKTEHRDAFESLLFLFTSGVSC